MLGDVLVEASELIVGQRQKDYGDPQINLTKIAELWTAYLDTQITGADVCKMMALLKFGRMITGKERRDDAQDAIGYLAIYADVFMGGQK